MIIPVPYYSTIIRKMPKRMKIASFDAHALSGQMSKGVQKHTRGSFWTTKQIKKQQKIILLHPFWFVDKTTYYVHTYHSINYSINYSINQSITQSINYSINQLLNHHYYFTKIEGGSKCLFEIKKKKTILLYQRRH